MGQHGHAIQVPRQLTQVGMGIIMHTDQPTGLFSLNWHLKVSKGSFRDHRKLSWCRSGGLIPSKWDPYPTPSHPHSRAKVQHRGHGVVVVPPAQPGVRGGVCTTHGATQSSCEIPASCSCGPRSRRPSSPTHPRPWALGTRAVHASPGQASAQPCSLGSRASTCGAKLPQGVGEGRAGGKAT